jgi:chromosome segregation protein
VKLKRLILQGFKSFKDRTTIHFDEGITGIVGPNGCGKSNVVDALFWVMGEQSAKHLRGNSMKDVIFAGSSKYSPGAFAEVSLVLENDDGKHIHIGNQVSSPTEIQLTRKLYRNGETEYRINDIPCRLRDIQEVFMDTGAGAKSYSIIAQGEINRLVQAKPEERRVMIEEVAGITKYKMRKRESLKKIEATEQNLSRLTDLQLEIEKNLKSLEKQAAVAERARDLKEKVQKYDLIVHAHKEFDLLKNYKEGKLIVDTKTEENEAYVARKSVIEIGLEEERYRKDEEMAKVEDLQKEFNQISKELAQTEERVTYLKKSQEEKEKLIETRTIEQKEIEAELVNRLTKLESLKNELSDWEKKGEEDHDFSLLEERVELLKEELELKTSQYNDLQDDIKSDKDALLKLDQEIYRNTTRLEEYANGLQDMTKEIEALEAQYSGVSSQIVNEREAVATAEKLSNDLKDQELKARLEIDNLNTSVRELESTYLSASKNLMQNESKLQSLIEVNKAMSSKKEGLAEFLKNHPEGFTLLGTLVKCDEVHTKSVQTILSDFMETLVQTTGSELEIGNWINSTDKAIDFFKVSTSDKLSNENIERLKISLGDNLISLVDIVDLGNLKEDFATFLDGYFVAESLTIDQINSISSDIKFKAIVSKDGLKLVKNLNGAKLISVISKNDEAAGFVHRNNLIEELKVVVANFKDELVGLESSSTSERIKLEDLKMSFDNLRDQAAEARAIFAGKKSALDAKLSSFETGFTRLEILKNRKNEISKSRIDLIEAEEKLSRKLNEVKSELSEKEMRFSDVEEEVQVQKANYENERSDLTQKKLEAKSFESTLKNLNAQIDDVAGQIERLNQRLTTNKNLVENYNNEINQTEDEHTKLHAENNDKALGLQGRRFKFIKR